MVYNLRAGQRPHIALLLDDYGMRSDGEPARHNVGHVNHKLDVGRNFMKSSEAVCHHKLGLSATVQTAGGCEAGGHKERVRRSFVLGWAKVGDATHGRQRRRRFRSVSSLCPPLGKGTATEHPKPMTDAFGLRLLFEAL